MSGRSQTTLFVSGLAPSSNETTLLHYFSPFGEVMDVQLPRQRTAETTMAATSSDGDAEQGSAAMQQVQVGAHRGFGFVVFATEGEAEDAIDNMNLNEVDGRIVNVSIARPSTRNAATGDSRKAIWDDEDWIKEHGGVEEAENTATQSNTEMAVP